MPIIAAEDFENPSLVSLTRIVVPTMEVTCDSQELGITDLDPQWPEEMEGKALRLGVGGNPRVTYHLKFNRPCSILTFWAYGLSHQYAIFNKAGELLDNGWFDAGNPVRGPGFNTISGPNMVRMEIYRDPSGSTGVVYIDNIVFSE